MARGPAPTVITLTKRQRDESETVASDEGARPRLRRARVALRARIVLAAADGLANTEVAALRPGHGKTIQGSDLLRDHNTVATSPPPHP